MPASSQRVGESWGQPVLVENRAGAGGTIAAEAVAKSPPTLHVVMGGGTHAVNVSLFAKLPLRRRKDFAATRSCSRPRDLVLHPSVPANGVGELIALARANPGKLTFASAGMGTASHLAGELFKTMAKVDMTHVPYKGNVPAITELLAGQTSLLFATMPTVLPQAKAGKLRALATVGRSRAAATPELPTVGEALPGFEVNNWIGLFAPAARPRDRPALECRNHAHHGSSDIRRGQRVAALGPAARGAAVREVRDRQMGAGGQGLGRTGRLAAKDTQGDQNAQTGCEG
jgi:tripartite-type tricarboxylate transporter receptor subunit TctC